MLELSLTPWGIATTVLCAAFAWFVFYPDQRWKLRHIPGPVGLPLVGNLAALATGMGLPDFALRMSAKYGEVCKIWFGARPWVVISNPDLVRRVAMKMTHRGDISHFLGVMTGVEGEMNERGILEAKGATWRAARKPFEAELINASSLHRHLPNMDTCAQKFCARLEQVANSGEVVDIHQELAKLTLSVVGESAYGVDFGAMGGTKEGQDFIDALKFEFRVAEVGKGSFYSILQLILPHFRSLIVATAARFPDAALTKHITARRLIVDISRKLLDDWRAKAKGDNAIEQKGKDTEGEDGGLKTNSFMASILRSNADGSAVMADADIIAQTWSFILAGYETTANTLCMATYFLSVNPSAEARLMAEIDSLGDLAKLDAESLDKMPYTDAVVKESLRLLGPAGSLLRTATEAFDLDLDGKVIPIPKGTIMMLATYTFHHDAKYWPRVDEFLPERFLPEGEATLGPNNPNAFLPFGIGSRSCPGYKFANMEAKISLVRMYQRFSFCLSPASQHPLKHRTGITLSPSEGLKVSVMQRKNKA